MTTIALLQLLISRLILNCTLHPHSNIATQRTTPPRFRLGLDLDKFKFSFRLLLCDSRFISSSSLFTFFGGPLYLCVRPSTQRTPFRSLHGYAHSTSQSRTAAPRRALEDPRAASCVPVCFSSPIITYAAAGCQYLFNTTKK